MFDVSKFEILLPTYLRKEGKDRLKYALEQFYRDKTYKYPMYSLAGIDWLQGDLLDVVHRPIFDLPIKSYNFTYCQAIILSNSCDLDPLNNRKTGLRDAIFAPLIDYSEWENELPSNSRQNLVSLAKDQMLSNIM